MMRNLIAALLVAAWSIPAAAERITVRSGEHDDFTRLVFYLPPGAEWSFREDGQNYGLLVKDEAAFFDTGNVFDFIPKSRIIGIESTGNRANIATGCDCHARAFDYHQDNIVVVDIVDGPPPSGRKPPPLPDGHEMFDWKDAPAQFPILSMPRDGGASAPPSPRPVADPGLAQVGALLGRQLSLAIGNGWADAAQDTTTRQTQPMATPFNRSMPGIALGTPVAPGSEDSNDRRATCLPAATLDVGAWASGNSTVDAIASARRALSRTEAEPDSRAVLDLVRVYAHAGFGAEANATVEAFGLTSRAARTAAAIARTIDFPWNGQEPELASQIHCSTPGALWALLAMSEAAEIPGDADLDAVQRTLTALPIHLRRHLSPLVAARLAAAGERERAASASLTVTRAGQATANGAADRNTPARTADAAPNESQQLGVARQAARAEIAPLISELESRASQGADIAPALRDRVEATLHEMKGVPGAAALLRSYGAALTETGDVAAAVATLERLESSSFFEDYDPPATLTAILEAATRTAETGAFLEAVDRVYGGSLRGHASDEVTDAVTRRLLDLGYPGLVSKLGIEPSSQDGDLRTEYLARRALSNGVPDEALARLIGSTSPAAAALRAEALEELGAYTAAAEAYLSLDRPDEAARAYWMAGAWEEAAGLLAPSPRRDLAQRAMARGPDATSIDRSDTAPPSPAAGQAGDVEPTGAPGTSGQVRGAGPRIDASPPAPAEDEALSLTAMRQTLSDTAEFRALASEIVREATR